MDNEVKQFLQRLESDVEVHNNESIVPHGERRCPICGNKMAVDNEQGIQTDVCSEHGVWLDVDELRSIMNKVRTQEQTSKTRAVREARKKGIWEGASVGIWAFLRED